jgi:hypothetical protein
MKRLPRILRQPWVRMWDASNPTFVYPTWLRIVAGYIGGDTPHVWTAGQWIAAGRRKKLPIFVANINGPRDGFTDGFIILQRLYTLGVPKGTPVVLDMETVIDPAYVLAVYNIVHWAGYLLWVYGTNGDVQGNPPCDGYWVATLDNIQRMVAGPMVRATQWADHGPNDTSIVKTWQYLHTLKTW